MTTFLLLLIGLFISLQFRPVQTYLAKKVAEKLSKDLNTKVYVGGLHIKSFKTLDLDTLYVEDLEKDTLLFSPKFKVQLNFIPFNLSKFSVKSVQMDNGKFYLKQFKDKSTNLSFIINYFKPVKKVKKQKSKTLDLTLEKVVLSNISFKYKNYNNSSPAQGINFNDIHLRDFSTTVTGLDTKNHLAKMSIENLTFKEKSGFYLKNLRSNAIIDTNQMEFKNLLLETENSKIADYFLMKYASFKDFNKFISKVFMQSNFKNSKINSSDIAFFSPNLATSTILLQFNGKVSGYVNNLKAKDLIIQSGQATYVKGDFSLKGLPLIKQTFMDLNFEQISTNKQDIDFIIARATGNKKSLIPDFANKLGTINFKGRFSGFVNNFISFGEFKTKAGRLATDINMKFGQDNIPSYDGTLKAIDFNIGELISSTKIGRASLSATISGKGFKISTLKEKIKSEIQYFEYNNYRYSNIKLDGNFNKKVFAGIIEVKDSNINLDFKGNIDLNPENPIYNFNALIGGANLQKLNFTKDTIQVDAELSTNFSGTNLDNIEGFVSANRIQLSNPKNSFIVDSINLRAQGTGLQRSLSISSDILDASIKGQYDLKTFPSYFKSVISRYIPASGLKFIKPGQQDFEFSLNIKYFDPISMLFIPDLKIPEQASFTGKFVSEKNIATLNGYIKLIQFKKIKINDLIIDEGTTEDALNLFISSDRIDITDSLFIKNVNIANILRNDSLNLNIKLSDKNANNQLDLNSLVEFRAEGAERIKLSILPSDILINSEIWKIQEKVSFSFDEGRGKDDAFSLFRRTKITGFELFKDNQMLTIDGIISENPDDELLIGFNKFKLASINPLTKPLGITLGGILNGKATLASLKSTPKLEAGIKIDSLNYNNLSIGNLNMTAGVDNATNLINIKVDIVDKGRKNLEIDGTYNANPDQKNLDMKVVMNNNEVVIFQPLLKHLISNMQGQVSADLSVTGKINKPQINGSLSLINAGMTINYLKTPYRINDQVEVENSVIKLKNLKLKDIKNNEAIANGTVDMANPNNPDINIDIRANKFMALNTTSKDNPLYYGVAYGTGLFRFNGPTNDMRININAKTEAGTVFNIPLNSSATVSKNDFITFISSDTSLNKPKETSFKGLTMDFNLQVDENSEVNIFTSLGRLSGRGDSELNLKITSLGDFEMYGDYLISSGKFQFTAQDFINKLFKISEGGSIRWTGNPVEATINLKALYEVRTAIAPLYLAAGRASDDNQKVAAEAVMNLSGPLMTPNISFDINFPANTYIKDELQSYLSDVNNTNQQALSLIVRRSFAGSADQSNGIGGIATSTFISAGSELFFNQLNTILSQSLNLNFVDLNIRSFNEGSASFRFLKDRLILTGGVTNRLNSSSTFSDFSVIGGNSLIARDVEAIYLLKKNGDLVLRASNKLNNRSFLSNLSSNNEYVSAIGLVYRKDFDSFKELLGILVGEKRKEARNQDKQKQSQDINAIKPEEQKTKKK
jgi:hypothetical protein